MLFAARTVILEPSAMPSREKLGTTTFALYLPFTNTTQARALSSSLHTISAPCCSIFGVPACAVNLVGSQLSLPLRTFASVYFAASFASQTVLSVVAVEPSLPPLKYVLRLLVFTALPLPSLLLYSPKTAGAVFMSGPQPSAVGCATIFVFRNTVLARLHERPR